MSVTTLPLAQEDLWDAWERVQENAGCAGSDGVTVEQFSRHAARLLARLLERVQRREYRPFPLLKIVVEKHPLTEENQKSKVKNQKWGTSKSRILDRRTPQNTPALRSASRAARPRDAHLAGTLAAAHLDLNREKTHIVDFQHGFRFLGALFAGEGIWVPWKNDRARGRLLFMARPMPLSLRQQYELPPPRNALQEAVARAEAAGLGPAAVSSSQQPLPRSQAVAFLYLTEQGSILRKAGDRLLVEKDDEVILDIPYHKLESVLLFGSIQVTTQALGELLEKGVHLSLFSRQGGFRGSLVPPRGKNVDLRLAQFERHRDGASALQIAAAIVAAKIANGLAVLDRYRARNDVPEGWEQARQALERSIGEPGVATVQGARDIAALDGVEGAAARAYFGALMVFNRSSFTWPGRVKHPATDPLNAMLSLTYTLLMNEFTALLEGAGLDPYLGFLHQVDYGRPSLALDMMEPFRHPVADRFVMTMINRAIFDSTDFRNSGDRPGTFLASGAMKRYLAEYERWMLARPARFREVLRTEVERLVGALREGTSFQPFRFDAGLDSTEGDGPAGEIKSQEVAAAPLGKELPPVEAETTPEAPEGPISALSD
jgi:CRISPR-associated protein Cas1